MIDMHIRNVRRQIKWKKDQRPINASTGGLRPDPGQGGDAMGPQAALRFDKLAVAAGLHERSKPLNV